MTSKTDRIDRPAPAFRSAGAYALMVFLHARTIARCGWDKPGKPSPEGAAGVLADAQAALAGMARYRTHPFRRFAPEPPTLWRKGSVRVLDFGGTGPPVLAIPSMINGSAIMDLSPDLSPLRWMAGQGFRVFLLDWGAPGDEERRFGLDAYLDRRLAPALEAVTREGGGPAHLIGYCMGGPLMLALAKRQAASVSRIATLGAPWDFTAFPEHESMKGRRAEMTGTLATTELLLGEVPPPMTQSFFAVRDLASGVRKYRQFAAIDMDSAEARRFVAVEDWLNDGVPLAPKVARECFLGWLIDDTLRHGGWSPGGEAFRAEDVPHPALVVSAQRDSVVRVAASEPLAAALPNATLLSAPVGHIGMVVGRNAIEEVWQPLASFLRG